jgi:hypothetical protein
LTRRRRSRLCGRGDLANWYVPGGQTGVGGAMDLVQGAKRVWVARGHTDRFGRPKIVGECTLVATGLGVVSRERTGTSFRVRGGVGEAVGWAVPPQSVSGAAGKPGVGHVGAGHERPHAGQGRGTAGEAVAGAGGGPAVDAVAEGPARVLGLGAPGQVVAGAFHHAGRRSVGPGHSRSCLGSYQDHQNQKPSSLGAA